MKDFNENAGSLFINDRAHSGDAPQRRGFARINGIDYQVSSWEKISAAGQPYWTLAFTPKQDTPKTS